MDLFEKCNAFVKPQILKKQGVYPYFRPISGSEGPIVTMEGKSVIMAGSNNYLDLTNHPDVKNAAIEAVEQYGTSCSGSRFLTGTIDLHNELEKEIADFMGKESAMLFTTGFQTSQGVIAPLVEKGDYIISDKDNHASIVAGNMLAASKNVTIVRYKHNNIEDLEKRLSNISKNVGKLIVTDGVFSTDGGIAYLDKITAIAKEYNAKVLVDDAHSFGVIGSGGRGTGHYFGVQDKVDLVMCTFSKSLASVGGFVAGDETVINYLKHKSPALIYSASPTPASVAAAIAALKVLQQNPDLPAKVCSNADKVRKGLRDLGFTILDGKTAIVPVIVGDDEKTFKVWKMLYDEGVFVNAFVAPTTPPGMQMLRTSYMASHTEEHLEYIVDTFKKVGIKAGLI
ncbi:pyridoxal phosphate-dependent aminotransferase family protein [Marivirga harenae]|uniref:aminotransferase class I/II-fold pyridoxal phosphate-dependent enzyme n=1 Tax=Marivirga harenae TaxID=2010992 RepID=UPI0026E0F5A4|nr:pyridoxal phosphate-dependent aminotransferase family protein [Marivirga harenae]WKV11613.1 pyridoxal phosphate-dependent aminotransferase family protein [Marivirga harenae]|tara:strand:- start:111622 stop:112812 length:1191 start_codon:yes stop_codon:yes gene_type:complete